MCGIAGMHVAGGVADVACVEAMAAGMVHRGPDGAGCFAGGEIALAVRRLAIIDPEGGDQPLFNEDRDIAVVFNGELYNHRELRAELESRGHRLRSGSDGEVIPHLFEQHGPRLVERLNGIFAIALWDEKSRTLHLMRDAFGVKPLYYSQAGGRLAFASELRALLVDRSIPNDLDQLAVDDFLSLGYVPSPRTPLAAVRKLAPATVLHSGPSGIRHLEYAPGPGPANRRDRAELVAEYADAFERAVSRQMMSDRPIGVMLSGGVDSGGIAAVMARHSSRVRAYTVGFAGGDARSDEIPRAARTAAIFGAEHESVLIGEREYLDGLQGALLTLEEPVSATSALAVRFVADLMRPSVPVALCGQGADEPLGGYGRHRGVRLIQALRRLPGARALAAALPRPARRPALARGLDALGARDDLGLLVNAYRVLGDEARRELYRPEFASAVSGSRGARGAIERLRRRVADRSPLGQMLYVDTRLSLPDELLLIADKMSMAASVELRVPFLDRDLIALVESAAPTQHVRRLEGKSLHKEAMLRLLPREITHRPKLGWRTPVDRWLRRELRPLLEEVLLGDGELCPRLLREAGLRRLIDAHALGRADHTRVLFCLLSLGLWYRAFVAARPASAVATARAVYGSWAGSTRP
jgi:asparagine synthase (glutamine-hydrolysing)